MKVSAANKLQFQHVEGDFVLHVDGTQLFGPASYAECAQMRDDTVTSDNSYSIDPWFDRTDWFPVAA